MGFLSIIFRWARVILMAGVLIAAAFCGWNAYYYLFGPNPNGIAVAAWSAFGGLFLMLAIFLMVANGISQMNTHLDHIADNADEQLKALRYLAKQNRPPQ